MPNFNLHEAQAKRNQRLLELLNEHDPTHDFPDWVMTVSFYKALHLAESYFHRKGGRHYKNHIQRNSRMATDFPECEGRIWRAYMTLLDLSKDSRYECRPHDWLTAQVQKSRDKLKIIEEEFARLELNLDGSI
jgi:hypothetical protein